MDSINFNSVGILQIDGRRFGFRPTELYQEYGSAPIMKGEFLPDVFEASNLRAKAVEYLRGIESAKSAAPQIKNVYFNDPVTVFIWGDGSKTIVRCQPGDTYSKETGLALCIAKKYLGNKGNFNEVFKKWIPEEAELVEDDAVTGAVNLKRSGNISVGDTVRVVNSGQHYSGYSDWIELHVNNPGDAEKWGVRHGKFFNSGDIGVVKYIAPHEWRHEGDIAYVEIGGYCYVIHVRGLEKVREV